MSWISKNIFLGEDDMKENAKMVFERLSKRGFSRNAICAILANMECESTINPGIWENLQPYIGGYGLVQWTPYEKYSEWAGADWQNNGDAECDRIAYEFDHGIQYYATNNYPLSAAEFKVSNESPEYLAGAWMENYERPWSYQTEWYRKERAKYWYDYFDGKEQPSEEKPAERKKVSKCLLLHRN